MSILASRYRSTTAYFEVYKQLIKAVRAHELLYYKPLIAAMKLKRGNYAAAQVGYLLGELNEDVARFGLPMISAIIVNTSTNEPGLGFYEFAVSLGRIPPGLTERGELAFWESEVELVFNAKWPPSAISFTIKRHSSKP